MLCYDYCAHYALLLSPRPQMLSVCLAVGGVRWSPFAAAVARYSVAVHAISLLILFFRFAGRSFSFIARLIFADVSFEFSGRVLLPALI